MSSPQPKPGAGQQVNLCMGLKWNARCGQQQFRPPVHGNCHARLGAGDLSWTLLWTGQRHGCRQRAPSALGPHAQCTNTLGTVQRLKGYLGAAQHWAKGAEMAQQMPRQALRETLQEMLVREGSSPSRHHKEPGLRLKLSRLRL